MADSKTQIIEYQGRKLFISYQERQASSHYVFFMHGWGCSKECFDEAYNVSELNDFSLCSSDFIGFGKSDKPKDFSYDLEGQAAIIAAFIATFNPEKVTLVGHSMGGAVALLCAPKLRHTKLHAVISAEGNLFPGDTSTTTRLVAKLPLGGMLFILLLVIKGFSSPAYKYWSVWCRQATPTAIKLSAKSLARWSDSDKLLPMWLNLRGIYVYGSSGRRAESPLLSTIPDKVCIPDARHFMMLDNPQAFYRVLVSELKNNKDIE